MSIHIHARFQNNVFRRRRSRIGRRRRGGGRRGYMLEWRSGSNINTYNLCFGAKIIKKKIGRPLSIPQFCYIKVGFKLVYVSQTCYADDFCYRTTNRHADANPPQLPTPRSLRQCQHDLRYNLQRKLPRVPSTKLSIKTCQSSSE